MSEHDPSGRLDGIKGLRTTVTDWAPASKTVRDWSRVRAFCERSIYQGQREDVPALRKIRTAFDLLGVQKSEKEVEMHTRHEWNEPLAGDDRRLPEWIDAQVRELEQSTSQPYSPRIWYSEPSRSRKTERTPGQVYLRP
jgi:hypothetical protein